MMIPKIVYIVTLRMERKTRRHIIRYTEKELVRIENDRQGRGKILIYIAPNATENLDIFHVGISWDSLEKLEERIMCDIFHWEVGDSSLKIWGKSNQWHLHLANNKNGSSFEIMLSAEETGSLKEVLFENLQREKSL